MLCLCFSSMNIVSLYCHLSVISFTRLHTQALEPKLHFEKVNVISAKNTVFDKSQTKFQLFYKQNKTRTNTDANPKTCFKAKEPPLFTLNIFTILHHQFQTINWKRFLNLFQQTLLHTIKTKIIKLTVQLCLSPPEGTHC